MFFFSSHAHEAAGDPGRIAVFRQVVNTRCHGGKLRAYATKLR